MNVTKDSVLEERYQKMLACQGNGKPVVPMRELEELWGLTTTSAVSYVLKKLTKRGKVIAVPKGKYHQYIAVEEAENG